MLHFLRPSFGALGLACALPLLATPCAAQTPTATLRAIQLHHDEIDDLGVMNLNVEVDFEARGLRRGAHAVEVVFSRRNGNKLIDRNDRFRSTEGQVAVSRTFEGLGGTQDIPGFTLGIPYDELHLTSGHHPLLATVRVVQLKPRRSVLATSTPLPLEHTVRPDPGAKIHRSWIEQDARESGIPGLRIHVDASVRNLRGVSVRFVAYFYDARGKELKDTNGRYRTYGDTVSAGTSLLMPSDDLRDRDVGIFIPYTELHLPSGRHQLSCDVSVFDERETDEPLAHSEGMRFHVER